MQVVCQKKSSKTDNFYAFLCSPTYNISITGVVVGNTSEDVEFSTLFDTGTSFTYLANPTYSFLTDNVS